VAIADRAGAELRRVRVVGIGASGNRLLIRVLTWRVRYTKGNVMCKMSELVDLDLPSTLSFGREADCGTRRLLLVSLDE
jgi:hypothetical protein